MRQAISLFAGCWLLWSCTAEQEAPEIPAIPGTVLWQYETGGQPWTPLALQDGVLYFGDDSGTFYALDTATREPRWQLSVEARIRSAAETVDDTVLFASDSGTLHALERRSGDERWKFDLGSGEIERRLPATDPPFEYDYLHSSPIAHKGVVYVGSADGHLYAVDLETGLERWRFATGAKIRSTPTVSDDTVYVGSWDGRLYAIAAATGEKIWSFDTEAPIQSSPIIAAGRVIVGSRSARMFGLDSATGEVEWTHVHEDGSWVESSPVARGGTFYIGSSDGLALFAFDASTGRQLWRFETGGWSWGTPLVTAKAVYIGGISAYPYYFEGVDLEAGLYSVDRETGLERWRLAPEPIGGDGYITGGMFSSPRAAGGVIYAASLDGQIYAISE